MEPLARSALVLGSDGSAEGSTYFFLGAEHPNPKKVFSIIEGLYKAQKVKGYLSSRKFLCFWGLCAYMVLGCKVRVEFGGIIV